MIERRAFWGLGLVLILGLGLILGGCSSLDKKIPPVEQLLASGEKAWTKKKWSRAAEYYGQIRDYYPYHSKAGLAQFRAAEALYRDESYVESLAAFETYDQLHPIDKRRPHVLLRIAQSHFRESPGIDRDQSATRAAVKAFLKLKKLFPRTKEWAEGEKVLKLAYQKIIRHELYVARFYAKTKAYKSAINRYQKALSYPEVGFGPRIRAELAIVEAKAAKKRPPRIKLPPEPKDKNARWWKIWQ